MIDDQVLEQLAGSLRGALLMPDDDGYEEARSLFNGMIDRRPAMIVQCAGAADVRTCVDFARENGVPLSVKAGGHGVAGKAVREEGLVIDLSQMKGVLVDRHSKIARVQAGATLGDLDHETQAFGLATPAGVDSRTGVAGLALGGGVGHLARAFGTTADNLLAAEVVTADGSLVRASESENPDLLWALRGGGGNFGVVTSFEFRLHELGPEILTAQVFHLFEDAREVVRFYRDHMAEAPKEVGCTCIVLRVPPAPPFPGEHHGKIAVALVANYAGDVEEGESFLKPLEQFGNPILSVMMPMPYVALQSAFDAGFPAGARYYWKARYLSNLSDEAIDTLIRHTDPLPGELSAIGFETMGGAINQVGVGDTAFPHRNARFGLGIFGGWMDPERDDEVTAWARRMHEAMEPYSTGGVYVNYIQGDAGDETRGAYGANYARLREVKAKYDPDNVFDAHEAIAPAAGG